MIAAHEDEHRHDDEGVGRDRREGHELRLDEREGQPARVPHRPEGHEEERDRHRHAQRDEHHDQPDGERTERQRLHQAVCRDRSWRRAITAEPIVPTSTVTLKGQTRKGRIPCALSDWR